MSKTVLQKSQREIKELLSKPKFIGWTKGEQAAARTLLLNLSRAIPKAIHDMNRIKLLENRIAVRGTRGSYDQRL